MNIKAVIWDLDGTLLNTLDDLAAAANAALAQNSMPQKTTEEIRRAIGNGIRMLIVRIVPGGEGNPAFGKVYDDFVAYYGAHSRERTQPYPGVLEALDALCARGVRHAVVSNKIDFAVKALCAAYFGDRIAVALGDAPARRRKPEPDGVLEAMRQLGVTAAEAVYVGDSEVDAATAKSAGLRLCAVSWGYRPAQTLREAGAQSISATPEALLDALDAL